MKKLLLFLLGGALLSVQSCAQKNRDQGNQNKDDQKQEVRESPLQKVTQKISDGATVTIQYGQPSLKGRVIGKAVEPMEGKVWRTGANEATTFETDKDVTVDGQKLPAGKYGFFTLFKGNTATIIFNQVWEQWGAFAYDSTKDVLRVDTKVEEEGNIAEKLNFTINQNGEVDIFWGNKKVVFLLK